jgi:hypothetical protein
LIAKLVEQGVEVRRSDGGGFILPAYKARELGLSAGRWVAVKVTEQDTGIYVRRSRGGERVGLWLGHPDTGELVKALCWDLFSSTTGIQLAPGSVGKYRLEAENG